jgi:hypothetical protein
MSSIEIKKFRNSYDLELIPASKESLTVGTLVWDPLLGKPEFDHDGMSENIFNVFLDAKLIDETQWEEELNQCSQIALEDAAFAERTVDVDTDLSFTLEHPQLGKLDTSFDIKLLKKFSFDQIQVKSMTNHIRVHIDDCLEELKKNHWDAYDGSIRRVFMITELYYGTIKIVIDIDQSANLEAAIEHTDLVLALKENFGKSVEYSFSHSNIPFAMRLEKVKTFNC